MVMPRGNFLLLATLAAMPALAQSAGPAAGTAGAVAQSAASVPELSPLMGQYAPGGVPFAFYNLGMEMLQQRNTIILLYTFDHEVRHVRLTQAHPANLTPSWFGDSVAITRVTRW